MPERQVEEDRKMGPRPVACTIIARNYLAHARCLAESFLAHHPDGLVYALLVDRVDGAFDPAQEKFVTLPVEELSIPWLHEMILRYDLMELCTAVKPFLLAHLRRTQGHDAVCYLDPDILVYGPFEKVWPRLRDHAVVLTPHLLQPVDDHFDPDEAHILMRGAYNLGFIGIGEHPETAAFLSWWCERLQWGCLVAPDRGLFVDQKWLDLVPGYFSAVHIVRDPGYNAAYWDIATRHVTGTPGAPVINGVPLAFFHFSGFDPSMPDRVSKYQNRATFSARPDLRPLFDDYRARLIAHGHADARRLPNALLDATPPRGDLGRMRTLLRNVRLSLPERWTPGPLENAARASALVLWCGDTDASAPGAHGLLSPVMHAVYRDNPSLPMVFAAIGDTDEIPFAIWFVLRAGRRHGVHWKFRLPVALRIARLALRNPRAVFMAAMCIARTGLALRSGRHPLLPERSRLHL